MTVRRLVVLVDVSALAAVGCGESNEGAEPPLRDDSADPSFSELVTGLAELTVDRDRYGDLLAAGCGAWVPRAFEGDAASFNDWIYLRSGPDRPIVADVVAGAGVDPEGLQATVDDFCDVPEPASVG